MSTKTTGQRAAKARRTRRRMRASALELFVEDGYAATSMQAIADRAEVAVQTLYFTFESKRALLKEILDVAIAGDEEPVPTLDRSWVEEALAARPAEQLRLQAQAAREIYDRVGPVLDVIRSAAGAHRDIAELWETNNAQRATVQERMITALAEKATLRAGLDVATATDIALVLQSPEAYQFLTQRRGWPPRQWESWTAQALIDQLLGSRSEASVSRR